MRIPLIVGNWKMNTTPAEASALARELVSKLPHRHNLEMVVTPPFTSLAAVAAELHGSRVKLAAQDLHWEDRGAFTGAISHLMLEALGCTHVLVGHSERRIYFGETDHRVNLKVRAALRGGLAIILCIGEELLERETGRLHEVLVRQLDRALDEVPPASADRLSVAYEPVWAIGTGQSATVEDAAQAGHLIRRQLEQLWGAAPAERVRVLYGGSVTPANAGSFAEHRAVDGVLVGGASLKASDFAAIASAGW
jgi:triosephosphate isomerase